MKIDGGCSCGAIKIEGEADPEKVQICHCTDCQTSTGTAFRISIPVPGDTFKMTGQPNIYVKTTADSGKPRRAGILRQMRLADLFDDAGRRRAAVLHGAGRHFAPARSAGPAAAEMVSLGAAVGHESRCGAEKREAGSGLKAVLKGHGIDRHRRRTHRHDHHCFPFPPEAGSPRRICRLGRSHGRTRPHHAGLHLAQRLFCR